jgi:ribonucleoside-diphosphate reductase alpha chain
MGINVRTKHGLEPIDESQINLAIQEACEGLKYVEWSEVATRCAISWYNGITTDELSESTIMAACSLIEFQPNYDFVAARLLLRRIYKEVRDNSDRYEKLKDILNSYTFATLMEEPHSEGNLADSLRDMRPILKQYQKKERDLQFRYQGVKILYDRYLLRDGIGNLLESPQDMFMRVSCGIAISEKVDVVEWAKKFYDCISSFDYMPSTPTLFNAGLKRPQMASCYVQHVPDSLEGIFNAYKDMAEMSKWAGGIGTNWSSVRASGAKIKGTNGNSTGIVPWLKIQNDIAIAVNQGGKRRGSHCAYIEPWHADIEEFLDLRKGIGDDRRRTHDLDTALWIPDLFMKRVEYDQDWSLFCPSEAAELANMWGSNFDDWYIKLEIEGKARRTVKAHDLWRQILTSLYETGHPWITFKDRCNEANPLQKLGIIRSSNLCTEITLNTNDDEIAVCNLGSINLSNCMKEDGEFIDHVKIKQITALAIRMLDNVVEGMWYPNEKAAETNKANRPLGLGIMGWQDLLYKREVNFDSQDAVDIARDIQVTIKQQAYSETVRLAHEKGYYPNWIHSNQSVPRRNSYLLAIAPTATISNIIGVSPSIEPLFSNLFVQSNLSGEFTNINRYLVEELIELDLWTDDMRNQIKYHNGSIQNIQSMPQCLKDKYKTAFEIDQKWLIDQVAARQKHICQSQSLNLYTTTMSGKALSEMYMYAWKQGLKTTYYLRTKGASSVEKSTVDPNQYGKTHIVQQCKIDDEECESCQ